MKLNILVAALVVTQLNAATLKLPQSLSQMAVSYQKTYQLNEFCCGYNALFNACNLERTLGFPLKFSDYSIFKRECMNYLKPRKIGPREAVTNRTLEKLASIMDIRICNLNITSSGVIQPFSSTPIEVSYYAGTKKSEIDRKMQEAIEKRGREIIKHHIDYFNNSVDCVVHFICIVKAEGTNHAILVSIVQNSTGRGLYIFDNMNAPITERSPITKYINYLCKTFAISYKSQFRAPALPERWPTVPSRY